MFLHVSVILSMGVCIPACITGHTPQADTPLGRHPLGRHSPQDTVNERECILVLNITKILPLNSVNLGAIQLSMISEFEFKF